MKIRDLASKIIVTSGTYFGSDSVHAGIIDASYLEDHVVDLESRKPSKTAPVSPVNVLAPGDIVVGLSLDYFDRHVSAVGMYLPETAEPLSPSANTRVLRPNSRVAGASLLAGLIARMPRKNFFWQGIQGEEVELLTEERAEKFIELLRRIHELRVNHRKTGKLLGELALSVAYKFSQKDV